MAMTLVGRSIGIRLLAIAALALVAATGAAVAQQTRGFAVDEQRLALVIGNSAYPSNALDNSVNDARLMDKALQQAGFKVTRRENLDRNGMVNAFREFSDSLNERTIAVVYYAGHALQLRDNNYLVPIDAEIRSEDEIPIAGLNVGFILGRMSHARSRIKIVILDACRNNPFAGKTRPARGLAQMDAPVGTLLAYATAPGKVAEDGPGPNSLYTMHLAKQLLTPGLPVESMFKRVREAVIEGTGQQQVPWESSSLLGEFAFVPGVAAPVAANAAQEAAGELAFWKSIEDSTRSDEYRAYLRQYPEGRFAELAKARIAAFGRETATPAGVSSTDGSRLDPRALLLLSKGGRPELLPRPGDSWRYRVQDQFRIGDLFLTATVDEITADGVVETWTTTSDSKVRSTIVPTDPGFYALPGWSLTPPEFSPYLLASGPLQLGRKIADQRRDIDRAVVVLKPSVEGEEEVVVAAGRFRTTKLILRGRAQARGAAPITVEHSIWYSAEVKRFVKYTVSTRIGNSLQESASFELMEFRIN
jgi:uncharacterized caspase-like protein